MPRSAKIYSALIASPSDVAEEREAARRAIYDWNASYSGSANVFIEPILWETHLLREIGKAPQQQVNEQLVSTCDFVIGIFWSRIGTPTKIAAGGAVEEVRAFVETRKPAIVFFSDRHVDTPHLDVEQYKRLADFRKELGANGLYWPYSDTSDFRVKLAGQLDRLIKKLARDEDLSEFQKKRDPAPSAYDLVGDFERLKLQATFTQEFDRHRIDAVLPQLRRNYGILERSLHRRQLRILDVGCGNGIVTKSRFGHLSDAEIIGIDKSEDGIKEATEWSKSANIRYQVKDITGYLDDLGQFDLVFCAFVLHHCAKPRDVLQSLWRLVRPGGVVIIRTTDDGLKLNYSSKPEDDRELMELITLTDQVAGSSDRYHGRKVFTHASGLDPTPRLVETFYNPRQLSDFQGKVRGEFFKDTYEYRSQYAHSLANASPKPNAGEELAKKKG